ncbi:hypothetical protein JCM11641_005650 [Rhodosporidiobolus odoratus]
MPSDGLGGTLTEDSASTGHLTNPTLHFTPSSPSTSSFTPGASTSTSPAVAGPASSPSSSKTRHARPAPRARTETGASESHYMASASGSQTDGGGAYETSSESEDDAGFQGMPRLGQGGYMNDFGSAEGVGRRLSAASGWGWAGEAGRGEHVFVQRRSPSPGFSRSRGFGGLDSGAAGRESPMGAAHHPERERSWASALLDTLEGHPQASKDRRRPSSPSFHATAHPRSARASPRPRHTSAHPNGGGRVSPEVIARAPSPPLTLDSITSTYNPFPLFHIRRPLIFEVTVLVVPLLFALFRLYTMHPTSIFPTIPSVPLELLLLFTLSIPFLTLFRRPDSAFAPPFTDHRGYRPPKQADDGVAAALSLPILLSSAVWWDTYSRADGKGAGVGLEGLKSLVQVWEANGVNALSALSPSSSSFPSTLDQAQIEALSTPIEAARALFRARYELVLITFLNAVVLLVHLGLAKTVLRIDKLPKSNSKRFVGFMGLAAVVSAVVGMGMGLWDYLSPNSLALSPLEAVTTSYIQQSSFYIVSRLARRGFTLGELNTMTAAGNALCLEFWRLSQARWYYKRGHPTIPLTFRAPTPVVAFQAVLIPGAFLSGFLLSPLLVLSRSISSRPSHRLKWPHDRTRHRRLLALGIALGLGCITIFFLGGWTSWILSSLHTLRKPWVWAIQFLWWGDSDGVERWPSRARARGGSGLGSGWWKWGSRGMGGRGWRRLGLVGYWAGVISTAVGGWQTHLVRARRIRMRSGRRSEDVSAGGVGVGSGGGGGAGGKESTASTGSFATAGQHHAGVSGGSHSPVVSTFAAASSAATSALALRAGGGGGGGGAGGGTLGANGDSATTQPQLKVRAESARAEKAVHASLNMRRKFFHALAVVMFVPGIAVDPAFTSLSFSLAFTLFTFAEYCRFFALYPFGAPLHIFFSEFIDSKDAGPVILSHFYLLTGCAGGLWLEGSGINRFTGVLVLGVGDSMASIVGKLFGRTRWPYTPKTIEGTAAFIFSVVICAWFFRLIGIVEHFSLPRYFLATLLAGLFEACSQQNDNLVIPIYMWSIISLLNV